jgi:hypothetical protein
LATFITMRLVVKRWKCVVSALAQSSASDFSLYNMENSLTLDSPLVTTKDGSSSATAEPHHPSSSSSSSSGAPLNMSGIQAMAGGLLGVLATPKGLGSPYVLGVNGTLVGTPFQDPIQTPLSPPTTPESIFLAGQEQQQQQQQQQNGQNGQNGQQIQQQQQQQQPLQNNGLGGVQNGQVQQGSIGNGGGSNGVHQQMQQAQQPQLPQPPPQTPNPGTPSTSSSALLTPSLHFATTSSPAILNPHQHLTPKQLHNLQLHQERLRLLRHQQHLLQQRDLLNAYTTRHSTHIHTLTSLSLTLLHLPQHAIILALLFVKRLLSVPTLPPTLSTPAKLLLAGLMLSDAHLCDRTISMRTWATLTAAKKVQEVVSVKREALEVLGYDVSVGAGVYSGWLKTVRTFFLEDPVARGALGAGGVGVGIGGGGGGGLQGMGKGGLFG